MNMVAHATFNLMAVAAAVVAPMASWATGCSPEMTAPVDVAAGYRPPSRRPRGWPRRRRRGPAA